MRTVRFLLQLPAGTMALALCALSTLSAQSVQSVAPDRRCSCRIELRHIVTLGDDDEDLALSAASTVSRDRAGRFFVGPTHTPGTVAAFDAAGLPLRQVGTAGQGPGELGRVRYVASSPGDSLWVLHGSSLTLFSPSGEYVRSFRLPGRTAGFRFIPLADGRILLNNYFSQYPAFLLLGAQGKELRRFGTAPTSTGPVDPDLLQQRMAALPDGRIVVVPQMYRFGLEIFDTTGTLVRRFSREPSWFPRYDFTEAQRRARIVGERALPSVASIRPDSQSRVWVLALVSDPKWVVPPNRRAGSVGAESPGWKPLPVADYPRHFDSVIEVIDTRSGEALITQQFDAYLTGFTPDGLVFALREAPSGLLVVDVWRPVVMRSP